MTNAIGLVHAQLHNIQTDFSVWRGLSPIAR
jgi:hypothetical protein